MPLALFASLVAFANPGVLVVPSPGGPAPAEVVAQVARIVDGSDAVALELAPIGDVDAFRGALVQGLRECFPDLSVAQQEALVRLREAHGDEVYVALPTSADARDTFVWRFAPEYPQLSRVLTRRMAPMPASAGPADVRVIFLPWSDAGQTADTVDDLSVLGDVRAEVTVGGPDLDSVLDQLMDIPNECTPELDAATYAALATLAAADDRPLYLAVKHPKQRDLFAWRWTADGLKKLLVLPEES